MSLVEEEVRTKETAGSKERRMSDVHRPVCQRAPSIWKTSSRQSRHREDSGSKGAPHLEHTRGQWVSTSQREEAEEAQEVV